MAYSLQDRMVLVIGRSSGIARAVVEAALEQGARVRVAGRNRRALTDDYERLPVTTHEVDVTDDDSIARLADEMGQIDHLVSTVSARARGRLADLDRSALLQSLDTKVVGPTMLAKYFAPAMAPDGSLVLFSGVNAFKVNVGYLGVAVTNGAVDFLTRSLAVELAPIRVNAISPGVIDTGIWDSLGDSGKREYFAQLSEHNPARRIGTVGDVAHAVLFALTNTFLTGVTLNVDGGEPLS